MSALGEAWFSALGERLGDAERAQIAAYLSSLSLQAAVHAVSSWAEAREISARPAESWWNAEEAERSRLEKSARLDPADPQWLALNEALHGAAAVAGASPGHPFLRKYALYCGGRWPLGVYEGRFAIF